MNMSVAILVAIVGGSSAALFLYMHKGSIAKPLLALLRFLWMGLLIFSLFAPSKIIEDQKSKPHIISVLTDRSASVQGDVDSLGNILNRWAEEHDVQLEYSTYDCSSIPANGRWMYIGDGHIEHCESQNAPIAAGLVASKMKLSTPNLQAIMAPDRVLIGGDFRYELLLHETPLKAGILWNGAVVNGTKGNLNAPNKAGNFELCAWSVTEEGMDTLCINIQVVDAMHHIQLCYTSEVSSIGVLANLARNMNIGVDYVNIKTHFQQIQPNVSSLALNLNAEERRVFAEKVNGPTVFINEVTDQVPVTSFHARKWLPAWIWSQADYKVRGEIHATEGEKSVEIQGINVFKTAMLKGGSSFLKAIVEGLVAMNEPMQLQLVLPQRLYNGQNLNGGGYLKGNEGASLPANFSMSIVKDGVVIDRPAVKLDAFSYATFQSSSLEPGKYDVIIEAKYLNQAYVERKTIRVESRDLEEVLPLNVNLWKSWLGRDIRNVSLEKQLEELDLPQETILIRKEKPQHATWWYWGLVMFLASSEWYLRRRQGLV